MRNTIMAALVIVSTACGTEGPAGPAGPAGPSGPAGGYDRTKVYCLVSHGAATATGMTVTQTCALATDTPLSGACYITNAGPAGYYLSNSAPVDWADPSKAAGWSCSWSAEAGATVVDTIGGATAEMCCIGQ